MSTAIGYNDSSPSPAILVQRNFLKNMSKSICEHTSTQLSNKSTYITWRYEEKHKNSTTNIIINHYIVQLPGGRKLGNFYKSFEDFRKIIENARMPQNTWNIDNIEQNNSSLLFAQNSHKNTLFTIVWSKKWLEIHITSSKVSQLRV